MGRGTVRPACLSFERYIVFRIVFRFCSRAVVELLNNLEGHERGEHNI